MSVTFMRPFRFCLSIAIAVWLICSTNLTTHAATGDDSSCGGQLKILSVNGVFTDLYGAGLNARRIQSMLKNNPLLTNQPHEVKVVYNPHDPYADDLLEVFSQKVGEGLPILWSDFLDWLSGALDNSILNDILQRYLGIDGAQKLNNLKNRLNSSVAFSDPTVIKISTLLQSLLASGSTVLVVSHSQGNLYANAAYNAAAASPNSTGLNLRAIGFAQIADPAASVATGDGYVTSKTDLVIAGLFSLTATNTLIWNDDSVPLFPAGDRMGHNLLNIYTSTQYPAIRQHVLDTINITLRRVLETSNGTTTGPLTATMFWDIPGDVDLHTFEPTGTHVYYAARRGQAGFLDRDDTQGTGPEHYYTSGRSSSSVQTGTYRFGVNYFAGNSGGNGPRRATIHICALGVDYPNRSVVLPTPLRSSGNNSPTMLFTVILTKKPDGSLEATVQ